MRLVLGPQSSATLESAFQRGSLKLPTHPAHLPRGLEESETSNHPGALTSEPRAR